MVFVNVSCKANKIRFKLQPELVIPFRSVKIYQNSFSQGYVPLVGFEVDSVHIIVLFLFVFS